MQYSCYIIKRKNLLKNHIECHVYANDYLLKDIKLEDFICRIQLKSNKKNLSIQCNRNI